MDNQTTTFRMRLAGIAAECSDQATQEAIDALLEESEAAAEADSARNLLADLDARFHECIKLGLTAAEAYDSGYQDAVTGELTRALESAVIDPAAVREAIAREVAVNWKTLTATPCDRIADVIRQIPLDKLVESK